MAVAPEHGPGPWHLAMAKGQAMALGHGPAPWRKAMALSHGSGPWPQGHDSGPRPGAITAKACASSRQPIFQDFQQILVYTTLWRTHKQSHIHHHWGLRSGWWCIRLCLSVRHTKTYTPRYIGNSPSALCIGNSRWCIFAVFLPFVPGHARKSSGCSLAQPSATCRPQHPA